MKEIQHFKRKRHHGSLRGAVFISYKYAKIIQYHAHNSRIFQTNILLLNLFILINCLGPPIQIKTLLIKLLRNTPESVIRISDQQSSALRSEIYWYVRNTITKGILFSAKNPITTQSHEKHRWTNSMNEYREVFNLILIFGDITSTHISSLFEI